LFGKIPKLDTAIIVLVSWITVVEDLAQAVVAGTIMSALSFAWKQSTQIFASPSINDKGWKEFKLSGPLFFGSTQKFDRLFDMKSIEEKDVVLDFMESRVYDHSALVAINDLSDKFGEAGKTVHLRHLSPDCQVLLGKVHKGEGTPPYELIESDGLLDPVYEPVEESGLYGGYTSNIL
jgi:sulfate permease, SulP family